MAKKVATAEIDTGTIAITPSGPVRAEAVAENDPAAGKRQRAEQRGLIQTPTPSLQGSAVFNDDFTVFCGNQKILGIL